MERKNYQFLAWCCLASAFGVGSALVMALVSPWGFLLAMAFYLPAALLAVFVLTFAAFAYAVATAGPVNVQRA